MVYSIEIHVEIVENSYTKFLLGGQKMQTMHWCTEWWCICWEPPIGTNLSPFLLFWCPSLKCSRKYSRTKSLVQLSRLNWGIRNARCCVGHRQQPVSRRAMGICFVVSIFEKNCIHICIHIWTNSIFVCIGTWGMVWEIFSIKENFLCFLCIYTSTTVYGLLSVFVSVLLSWFVSKILSVFVSLVVHMSRGGPDIQFLGEMLHTLFSLVSARSGPR